MSDLIIRKDIEWHDYLMANRNGLYHEQIAYKSQVDDLPSAQPEIIRCKDCKFYGRADKRRFYRGSDCLNKRIDTIVPDRDFCSRAEKSGADMRGDENGEHD